MHILYAHAEAQIQALQVLPSLVPPDRLTPIRIRFYQLRLAKSAIFSPRLYMFQEAVDNYIRSIEEDSYRYSGQPGVSAGPAAYDWNSTNINRVRQYHQPTANNQVYNHQNYQYNHQAFRCAQKFSDKELDCDSGYSDG